MEKSKCLLNPKAAPYVPLSETAFGLGFKDKDKVLATASTSSSDQAFHYDLVESSIDGIQALSIADIEPSSSADMRDLEEEEYIMGNFIQCEEHLVNLFPDISKESLADVFYCNDGDLEDTIAMLEQLESDRFNESVDTSDDKGPLEPKCTEAIKKGSS